jgi:hypothetical protein
MVADETAMRLLHATREQLHTKPTRQVIPFEVAEMVGVNLYQREYDEAVQYLVDNDYLEPYPDLSSWLYRMTNKWREATVSSPPSAGAKRSSSRTFSCATRELQGPDLRRLKRGSGFCTR